MEDIAEIQEEEKGEIMLGQTRELQVDILKFSKENVKNFLLQFPKQRFLGFCFLFFLIET